MAVARLLTYLVRSAEIALQPVASKATILPPSSSTRQHHARVALYPRSTAVASCVYRSLRSVTEPKIELEVPAQFVYVYIFVSRAYHRPPPPGASIMTAVHSLMCDECYYTKHASVNSSSSSSAIPAASRQSVPAVVVCLHHARFASCCVQAALPALIAYEEEVRNALHILN